MDAIQQKLFSQDITLNEKFAPEIYNLNNDSDKKVVTQLIENNPALIIHDEIDGQLRELIKSLHPSIKIKEDEYPALIEKHLTGRDLQTYGVWVYYPWSGKLIHTLDEEEFTEIRTNRNRYKITREEQAYLRTKKIGVIGLSVGQSIALTLAMERTCGELRLADFDTAELSNLNRIRTGLYNLGLKKTVIAAREIAEIDPFIKVKIFNDGIQSSNINDFFLKDGKLDLLVEVCDGLDIKIVSRFKARELQIPVVMDTNDKGMLDVERFDLEPDRPILHGLAGDLNPDMIKGLTNEEKIPYILKMIGAETISARLKASMMEVEQSINTWPQLASSVVLGGALTTDVCRRILLDQYHDSGRYYVDLEQLVKDKREKQYEENVAAYEGRAALTNNDLMNIAKQYAGGSSSEKLTDDQLLQIVNAAIAAPSGGNAQPWKLLYHNSRLYLFHDEHFSYSLLDYNNLGSYIAFGAMLENINIKSAALGFTARADTFPLKDDQRLVAVISFEQHDNAQHPLQYLAGVIGARCTNRNIATRELLKREDKDALQTIAATVAGASLQLFEEETELEAFAEILSNTERIRFLHPRGHYDTFIKELKFTPEEVATAEGLDVQTLNVTQSDIAALSIAKDAVAINFLNQLHKGQGFKKITRKPVLHSSAIGVLSMPGHSGSDFLQGGRALERIWLEANNRHLSFQPVTQAIFMTERYLGNGAQDFNDYERQELQNIHKKFSDITGLGKERFPIFVFRVSYADAPQVRSLRRGIDKILFVN